MKKLTLSALLLSSMFSIANTFEEKQPAKITEQNRIKIVNSQVAAVFFWEIKTISGRASGYTNSLESAQKTIKLMTTSDSTTYKVIEMYK